MALPPAWKVKREFGRAGDDLSRRVARLYEPLVDRLHLRRLAGRVAQTAGAVPGGPKIAVFVVYQPRGLAESTLFTCRHLVAAGYCPMVVSNAPLRGEDRNRLAQLAWRIVERPNHGYDFGAYRDGLLLIGEAGCDPDVVVLMNDSTWFPLRDADRTLADLDARNAPFSGLSFKHEPPIRRGCPHMESHFLRFSRVALESGAFRDFWSGYVASGSRVTTIERGEKGITRAMQGAGFTPEAPLSREALLAVADRASAPELRDVLEHAVLTRPEDRARTDTLVGAYDGSVRWSSEARGLIADLTDSFANILSSAFVYAVVRHIGLPFLKKSAEVRFVLARTKIADLARSGILTELQPSVAQEIAASVSRAG